MTPEFLRSLLGNLREGIAIAQNGRFVYVSQAYCRIYGYTEDEMLANSNSDVLQMVHPDDKEKLIKSHYERLEGKMTTNTYEVRVLSKKLETRWLDASVSVIDYHGKPATLMSVIDITERKIMEEHLRESMERFHALVNITPDFIAIHDSEGRFLFLNHFAEGFGEKDVIGNSAFEFLGEGSREIFMSNLQECIQTWTPRKFEYTAFGDEGKLKIYESCFIPLLDRNKQVNVVSFARDITDIKQAGQNVQDRILEMERLANLTIGRELAMIGLKKEVNRLLKEFGKEEKYKIIEDENSEEGSP
jgi:PAS domain S-box-containing protein